MNSYIIGLSSPNMEVRLERVPGGQQFLRNDFSKGEWGAVSESRGFGWGRGGSGEFPVCDRSRITWYLEGGKKMGSGLRGFRRWAQERLMGSSSVHPRLLMSSCWDSRLLSGRGSRDSAHLQSKSLTATYPILHCSHFLDLHMDAAPVPAILPSCPGAQALPIARLSLLIMMKKLTKDKIALMRKLKEYLK